MESEVLYNLDPLKATTAGDDEFLVKILNTFVKNNKEHIKKLDTAVLNKDYMTVGEVAHKMLSSYKHLEVQHLITPLTELESITLGIKLDPYEIEDKVRIISIKSEEVFESIQKEIDKINV